MTGVLSKLWSSSVGWCCIVIISDIASTVKMVLRVREEKVFLIAPKNKAASMSFHTNHWQELFNVIIMRNPSIR